MRTPKRLAIGMGWAWAFGRSICHWAEPSREDLIRKNQKPSPDAIPVAVFLVPRSEHRKNIKKGKTNA